MCLSLQCNSQTGVYDFIVLFYELKHSRRNSSQLRNHLNTSKSEGNDYVTKIRRVETVMSPRSRSFVRPRVSSADVNYNHKSALASLRAAISTTTVLPARILNDSIDHSDVIHCAQGPHQSKGKILNRARLFCEEKIHQKLGTAEEISSLNTPPLQIFRNRQQLKYHMINSWNTLNI